MARIAEYASDARQTNANKRVEVFGLGYVGLPVSAAFASRGFEVIGIEVQPSIVETINSGRIHIVEPDLDMLVQAAVSAGKLRATLKPEPADAFIIAVPTPFKEDHEPDLRYVEQATRMIAPLLQKGNLIVLESTSPVGATEQICAWVGEMRPDLVLPDPNREKCDIHIAHCPERVLPGSVLRRGDFSALRRSRGRPLSELRQGRDASDQCPHRGVGQARRERVPRCQHRVRQ